MISEQEIREGYRKRFNKDMSDSDYLAFLLFMKGCECYDAVSYEDAHEKIMATFSLLIEAPLQEKKDRLHDIVLRMA